MRHSSDLKISPVGGRRHPQEPRANACVHKINAHAEKKVTEEFVRQYKRIRNKDAMLHRVAEVSLESPAEPVRDVIYPVMGGEAGLTELVGEYRARRAHERDKRRVFKSSYTFDMASTALRVLAPGAQVVLVGGHPGITPAAPDDPAARLALINVLAHAIKAQRAPEPVHVHVLDHMETPSEVTDAALGRSRATPAAPGADPDDSAMSYEDWRVEVMGLIGAHF